MRKCYLCGSLIRRKAEFCRYCTVRQRGATPGTPPERAADSASEPERWLDATDSGEDPAARDQREREAAVAFEDELRRAASRRGSEARRPILDPPPPPPPPRAPVPAPSAAPPLRPAMTWATDTVTARTVVDQEPAAPAPTNGANSTNGVTGANGARASNGVSGTNGAKGSIGANGTNGANGTHTAERAETVEDTAAQAPEPRASDHLRGFDDFPRASKNTVRWG